MPSIAALMVVYVHAHAAAITATGSSSTIPHNLAIVGAAGVDIFFVLSGVVIAKTAPGMTSAQFAWRRIRRILPIYLLKLAKSLKSPEEIARRMNRSPAAVYKMAIRLGVPFKAP
jgi:peptidoglycan/LPS O-acetylase OafA/YrhL